MHAICVAIALLSALPAQAQQTTDVVVMRRSLAKPNPKTTPTPTPVATKSTCTRPVLAGGSFSSQILISTLAEKDQAKGLAWCESFAIAQGCQYANGTVYLVGNNSGTYTIYPAEPTRWSTVCRKN